MGWFASFLTKVGNTMWKWYSSVTIDEEGNYVFPAGMCTNMHTADVGYGTTDEYPCARKAEYTVTFRVWTPNPDNTDGWDKIIMNLCKKCKTDMTNEDDKNGEMMEIVEIDPYMGRYDGSEEPDINPNR